MNTTKLPSAAEILKMRQFLARVVRTPATEIKLTGNPETDENADLILSHTGAETEKLCSLRAIEIDGVLTGEIDRRQNGEPDLARGTSMYTEFLAERQPLYT